MVGWLEKDPASSRVATAKKKNNPDFILVAVDSERFLVVLVCFPDRISTDALLKKRTQNAKHIVSIYQSYSIGYDVTFIYYDSNYEGDTCSLVAERSLLGPLK